VSRPEDSGGRLAMKIMEPMLSLVKSHTLRTCTLDTILRSSNAALPVLMMELVTKAAPSTGTASSPPQAAVSTRAAAPEPVPPASAPVPPSALGPTSQLADAAPAGPAPMRMQAAAGPSAQQPSKRVTLGAGSGAPGPSDGGGVDPQDQGRRTRKRSAAGAAFDADAAAGGADTDTGTDDADAPPAKKGRSQAHGQVSSGAAKVTQKRKAPSEQPPAKSKILLGGVRGNSKYRGGWVLASVLELTHCSTAMCIRTHTHTHTHTHTPTGMRTTTGAHH
jgi:hypothetical protein